LLHDPARREAFGRAGQQRSRDVFGVEAQAMRIQSIYDRLLANGQPGAHALSTNGGRQ
jgi:hypothetical protein